MSPPFSLFVNIGNGIKAKNIKEDTPPFAYAEESTLKDFSLIMRKAPLPTHIPVGIAHKSIEQLSVEYQLNGIRVLNYLNNEHKIKTDAKTPFKKIAKEHNIHPATLYAMFLASQV